MSPTKTTVESPQRCCHFERNGLSYWIPLRRCGRRKAPGSAFCADHQRWHESDAFRRMLRDMADEAERMTE